MGTVKKCEYSNTENVFEYSNDIRIFEHSLTSLFLKQVFSQRCSITDYAPEADILLQKFKWGHSFTELNQDLLDRYVRCRNSGQVVEVQQNYLAEIKQQDKDERLKHQGMYRKVPKFSDARKFCCNLSKIQINWPNLRVFYQKDANGIVKNLIRLLL